MAKYENASAGERYESAKKMEKEDWNPLEALGRLAKEKLLPKEAKDPVPPTPPKGLKKGGSVSSRADGCAQRGKTRGKLV